MDVYAKITDAIVTALENAGEEGPGRWRMPWHARPGHDTSTPLNAVSGRPYSGINVLGLWAAAEAKGYPTGEWATYKQWQEVGAQVRAGEKSTLIVFWNFGEREVETDDGDRETRKSVYARGYYVFNAAQVDGWAGRKQPKDAPAPLTEEQRVAAADEFFRGLDADVRHGGSQAYYRPSDDHIQMPAFETFEAGTAYYSTLAHEHVHWTGAKSRLDRDLSGRFKTAAYAAEELVAELGAAFCMARLGLSTEPRADHAQYIAGWIKLLKEDKRAIFTASSKAQAAVEWMTAKATASATQEGGGGVEPAATAA